MQASELPDVFTADQLDSSFDQLVNTGSMSMEDFYLAVIDLAYQGVRVGYHPYHKAFIIRHRALYEQLSQKEHDNDTPERREQPASRH